MGSKKIGYKKKTGYRKKSSWSSSMKKPTISKEVAKEAGDIKAAADKKAAAANATPEEKAAAKNKAIIDQAIIDGAAHKKAGNTKAAPDKKAATANATPDEKAAAKNKAIIDQAIIDGAAEKKALAKREKVKAALAKNPPLPAGKTAEQIAADKVIADKINKKLAEIKTYTDAKEGTSAPQTTTDIVPGSADANKEAAAIRDKIEAMKASGASDKEVGAYYDANKDFLRGNRRVETYTNDILDLDDTSVLEKNQYDAIASGSDEAVLKSEQELLRKKEKDQAVKDQISAEDAAQRTLYREQQAAKLSGEQLDRSGDALARQKDAITRTLASETRSFNEQQRQLAEEAVQLDRAEGSTVRKGQIAGRAGDAAAAQSANMAAQSGFGRSSAALGAQASAKSTAATAAGDILTNLVGIGSARTTLEEQGTLLGASFKDLQANVKDAFANQADQVADIAASKFKVKTRLSDIGLEQDKLRTGLTDNLDFLQSTFNLGGSISGANASINAANAATAQRDQQKAGALSLGVAGVTTAVTGNPVLGGVLIVKALADYFDF